MEQWTNISPQQLLTYIASSPEAPATVIDVREQQEWDYYHLEGTALLPMSQIAAGFGKDMLPQQGPLYIICAHGVRSVSVCRYLSTLGYENLFNVEGGMAAVAQLQGFQYD